MALRSEFNAPFSRPPGFDGPSETYEEAQARRDWAAGLNPAAGDLSAFSLPGTIQVPGGQSLGSGSAPYSPSASSDLPPADYLQGGFEIPPRTPRGPPPPPHQQHPSPPPPPPGAPAQYTPAPPAGHLARATYAKRQQQGPLTAGGSVMPGLREPYGPEREYGGMPRPEFTFRATGFRPEWGTPPESVRGHQWNPGRYIYEPLPRHEFPGTFEEYERARRAAERGDYVQAFRSDEEPDRWRYRWVHVYTPYPSLERPYRDLGEFGFDVMQAAMGGAGAVRGEAFDESSFPTPRIPSRGSIGNFGLGVLPGASLSNQPRPSASKQAPSTRPRQESAKQYNLADYAWVPQHDLPIACPYPYRYLPVPQADYASGRWLEPDYVPSIPLPTPYDAIPWRCGVPALTGEGKGRHAAGAEGVVLDEPWFGPGSHGAGVLFSPRLEASVHGIPVRCDLPGEPPERCAVRKAALLRMLNEDLGAPSETRNADVAFDLIEQPGGGPDLLVLKYTAPAERAGSLVQPTDDELGERDSLRALAGRVYLPEQEGGGGTRTSPEIVLVNNEFGLQDFPDHGHDPNGLEDVGVSPTQRGADGTILYNLDAIEAFRDDFSRLVLPGHDGQNPLNLVAALHHELTEHAYGNGYRVANGITAGDRSPNPAFDPDQPRGPDNQPTMRGVVYDHAHEHASEAESRMREQMGWPEIGGGSWRDPHPEGRDQPNRLQLTFRGQTQPGGPPAQEWTVLVHHDAVGGLVDAASYSHPSLRGLYLDFNPSYWGSEGALRAYRGMYVGR